MPKRPPLKLLLVDDHAAFRQTVRQWLESRQMTVLEAGSGEEALQRFSAERPDFVIMDLRMPGMGGLRATEAIRKLDAGARVILLSQFDEAELRAQARRAGAVSFLDKQDMSRLAEALAQPTFQS